MKKRLEVKVDGGYDKVGKELNNGLKQIGEHWENEMQESGMDDEVKIGKISLIQSKE